MNREKIGRALLSCLVLLALACCYSVVVVAQEQTTTVERGEVVYVAGNDVVVRMSTGEIRHVTVKPGATAVVDGKTITIADLKPGMVLQKTVTTTSTPRTVRQTARIEGKVWMINPPTTIILTLPDGKNKQYRIPEGTKFNVEGREATAFDLKKGMNVSATVVRDMPEVVVSSSSAVTGSAPKPAPKPVIAPAPQPLVGVLLIEEPAPPPAPKAAAAPAPEPAAAPEPAPAKLPKTGSELPLIGLAGLASSMAGMALRAFRRP